MATFAGLNKVRWKATGLPLAETLLAEARFNGGSHVMREGLSTNTE